MCSLLATVWRDGTGAKYTHTEAMARNVVITILTNARLTWNTQTLQYHARHEGTHTYVRTIMEHNYGRLADAVDSSATAATRARA